MHTLMYMCICIHFHNLVQVQLSEKSLTGAVVSPGINSTVPESCKSRMRRTSPDNSVWLLRLHAPALVCCRHLVLNSVISDTIQKGQDVGPEDWRGAGRQAEGGRVESRTGGEGALQDGEEGRVGGEADQLHGGSHWFKMHSNHTGKKRQLLQGLVKSN